MQHEQDHEGGTQQPDTSAEQTTNLEPRIHVVELDSAERGTQHGRWIDANQSPEDLDDDIAAMSDSARTVDAADWSIDDSEDFGGIDLTTVTDTSLISQLARGVVEHGHAFAAWNRLIAPDREQINHFEQVYVGTYATREAWARSLADQLGWHRVIDGAITDPLLRPYVVLDYTAIVQDSHQHWHLVTGADGKVHVFAR